MSYIPSCTFTWFHVNKKNHFIFNTFYKLPLLVCLCVIDFSNRGLRVYFNYIYFTIMILLFAHYYISILRSISFIISLTYHWSVLFFIAIFIIMLLVLSRMLNILFIAARCGWLHLLLIMKARDSKGGIALVTLELQILSIHG